AGAPRIGSSRRLKDSVIGEVGHHRVQVASVERCSELSEHLGVGRPHLLMPPRGIDLVPVRYRLSLPSHWPMQPLKGFRGPCRRRAACTPTSRAASARSSAGWSPGRLLSLSPSSLRSFLLPLASTAGSFCRRTCT